VRKFLRPDDPLDAQASSAVCAECSYTAHSFRITGEGGIKYGNIIGSVEPPCGLRDVE